MSIQALPTWSPPLFPKVLQGQPSSQQTALPLATEGVLRYVWEGRFGAMLIEVVDGVAYVNGVRVETATTAPPPGDPR